jgi:GNAT superfamily N-acetyltransferase
VTGTKADNVRPLRTSDVRTVNASVARAFSIDPMFDYFTRDLLAAHRSMPGFFAPTIRDVDRHGHGWVVEVDGVARGLAGWLGPGGFPRTPRREATVAIGSLPAFARQHDPVGGLRLLLTIERRHPKFEHWYLALLAVDPTQQGRGLGAAVIQPGIDAADDAGLPCYLETQKEANLAWYGRFGFEVTDTIRVGKVPPVWCMTRSAR